EAVERRVRELAVGGTSVVSRLTPIEIVQRVLEVSGDAHSTILLMGEIRVRALRNPEIAAAYLSLSEELVKSVARLIHELRAAHGLTFRTSDAEAARLLISFYESASANAAMVGLDDAAIA